MSLYFYCDVETLPSERMPELEELKCPGNIKKPESIATWWADPERQNDLAELHHKTSVDPYAGRIFCVAWAFNDEPIQVIWDDDEYQVLGLLEQEFQKIKETSRRKYESLSTSHIVGYNFKNFDNPYLKLRAIKYKCELLNKVLPARTQIGRIDDMMEIGMVTMRVTADKYVSQDKLAKFFGLPGKDGIDGSMVWSYYQQGKKQEIADYCKDDVEQLRILHQLMVDPNYMLD